jgi:hypothetical protein
MWGRRAASAQPAQVHPAATNAIPDTRAATGKDSRLRALSQLDDLLRAAEWERLTEADRADLLRPYAPLDPAAQLDAADQPRGTADQKLQDWVAQLVAPRLQAEPAAAIRTWLTAAPPDAHLFVGGRLGQGRTSLVAALARQAMASQPTPPDFCYVPRPSALERMMALPLPRGKASSFCKVLGTGLSALAEGWNGASAGNGSQSEQAVQTLTRQQLIYKVFTLLSQDAPPEAIGYLGDLRAALVALGDGGTLPFDSSDVPVGDVSAVDPAGAPATPGAPVVVASLVQGDLTGALIRANGGVLVLSAAEVINADGAWTTLAAALRSGGLPLHDGWPPLPLHVRVALVGTNGAYDTLASNADDFTRLFRYEAWCNPVISWTREAEAAYAMLADGAAHRYGLPSFDPSGIARLVEEGARRSEGLNRSQLITDLLMLRDLAAEAGRLAQGRGAPATSGADVEAVVWNRRAVQGVVARRVREAILTGQEITPTSGASIGQTNGLGILEFHSVESSFAVPTRISATVNPGRDERLLDIEHEAEQADADHVRGALTVEGYLASRYGQQRTLNVLARVRFEQEHGTMGGDSASTAVLIAILSALAEVPVRLSLAITGAVGQYGELQPIGGVNTKIEGFWELCRLRRERGEQVEGGHGVIIPAVNARDLMLRPEVASSIATEGWFHIWPVSTVDEALSLLTGMPPEQVHARVDARLARFHQQSVMARNTV